MHPERGGTLLSMFVDRKREFGVGSCAQRGRNPAMDFTSHLRLFPCSRLAADGMSRYSVFEASLCRLFLVTPEMGSRLPRQESKGQQSCCGFQYISGLF